MKLATVSEVRGVMQFDSMSNLDAAISASLHLATQQLSAELRSVDFTREDFSDVFYLPTGLRQGQDLYRFRCALSRGLLTAQPTVMYGAGFDSIETALPAAQWKCNLEKGDLVIHGAAALIGQYVQVEYTAGFAAGTGDDADTFQSVPDWLKQAAIQRAIANLMETNPELRGGSDEGAPRRSPRYLRAAADEIVASRIRYFAEATRPVV